MGNIYADEALYRAGIHPLRAAGRLTAGAVRAPARRVDARRCSAGIEARGATIDDFRHVDGVRGSFQDRFQVHRREGEPCATCGRDDREDGRGRARAPTCASAASRARAHAGEPARALAATCTLSRPSSSSRRPLSRALQRLVEAAQQLVADKHLGEGHHPGAPGQLDTSGRSPWRG